MTSAKTFANRFSNRRAIVTGGASGIGLTVAVRLAAEGAAVSLWDMNAEALARARTESGAADVQVLDISDPARVEAAMQASVAALGGLDVLVCSAGITGPNGPVRDYPTDAWKHVFDVNVHGLFYCNRAAIPVLEKTGYGRIVNVAS